MPRDGVVLSVYVTPDDAANLRARALAADRSVSAEVRRMLRLSMNEGPAATPSPRDISGAVGAGHACPAE